MPGESDLAAVLARLEKEKENLEIAISVIKKSMGMPLDGDTHEAGPTTRIKPDTFYRMAIAEAAVAYLHMTNRTPKTTAEIAAALDAGGLDHQSKDLKATVNAVLIRDGEKWGITRLKNGAWALDEWYDRERKQLKRGQGRSKERAQAGVEEAEEGAEEVQAEEGVPNQS